MWYARWLTFQHIFCKELLLSTPNSQALSQIHPSAPWGYVLIKSASAPNSISCKIDVTCYETRFSTLFSGTDTMLYMNPNSRAFTNLNDHSLVTMEQPAHHQNMAQVQFLSMKSTPKCPYGSKRRSLNIFSSHVPKEDDVLRKDVVYSNTTVNLQEIYWCSKIRQQSNTCTPKYVQEQMTREGLWDIQGLNSWKINVVEKFNFLISFFLT